MVHLGLKHAVACSVTVSCSARILLHLGQAVFVVEDKGVGHAAGGPAGLVAAKSRSEAEWIAVIAVAVAVGRGHGVFVAAVAVGIRVAGVTGQVADRIVGEVLLQPAVQPPVGQPVAVVVSESVDFVAFKAVDGGDVALQIVVVSQVQHLVHDLGIFQGAQSRAARQRRPL